MYTYLFHILAALCYLQKYALFNASFYNIPNFIGWHNLPKFKLLTSAALGLAVPIRFQNASSDSCRISIASKASQYNNTASVLNDGYVWTPSADLCATTTVAADKMVSLQTRNCLRVRASLTSKTATIQYKPVTSLTDNNNALAHYEQSGGYNQISYALSNIHGCIGATVISLTSYLYTIWTCVSCQIVSQTNGLGTRLDN